MHPLKERILRYEEKYGFNLEARRAFNQAIRGGGFFSWLSSKFKKKPTRQPKLDLNTPIDLTDKQQTHHTKPGKQRNHKRRRRQKYKYETIPKPRTPTPYIDAYFTPNSNDESSMSSTESSIDKIKSFHQSESPKNDFMNQYRSPYFTQPNTQQHIPNVARQQRNNFMDQYRSPYFQRQKITKNAKNASVSKQRRNNPQPIQPTKPKRKKMKRQPTKGALPKNTAKPMQSPSSMHNPQLLSSTSSTASSTSKKPRSVPISKLRKPTNTTKSIQSPSSMSNPQLSSSIFSTSPSTPLQIIHKKPREKRRIDKMERRLFNKGVIQYKDCEKYNPSGSNKPSSTTTSSSPSRSHTTLRVTRKHNNAPKTTSVISVWYEGKKGYEHGTTSTRQIRNGYVTITLPDNRIRNTTLDKVTFEDPKRFREAYCHLYNSIPDSLFISRQENDNLSNVNYYFKEHEHGGGGDCFLYAWLGSSLEQNNGEEYDDRIKDLLQTCTKWTAIKKYKKKVARGIISNRHVLQKKIKQAEMLCLREMVGNFMRGELERRADILGLRDKEIMKGVIQRISTKGTWLEDADIIKIADYMNMRFFVFVEATNTWQIYEPPTNPKDIYVPTYYIINKGQSDNNGWAGYHYKSLTKLYEGNFDCN